MATDTESWKNVYIIIADTADDTSEYGCSTTTALINVDDKFAIPTIGAVLKYGFGDNADGTLSELDIAVTNPFVVSKLVNGAKRLYKGGIEYFTGDGEDGGVVVVVGRVGKASGRPIATGRWVGGEVEIWSSVGDRVWEEYDSEGQGCSKVFDLEEIGEDKEEQEEGEEVGVKVATNDVESMTIRGKGGEIEEGGAGGGNNYEAAGRYDGHTEGPSTIVTADGKSACDVPPPPPDSENLTKTETTEGLPIDHSELLATSLLNLVAYTTNKTLPLPTLISTFYASHILPIVRAQSGGEGFQLKKTEWKKLHPFLKSQQFLTICTASESGQAVDTLQAIDRSHPAIRAYKVRTESRRKPHMRSYRVLDEAITLTRPFATRSTCCRESTTA